MITGRAKKADLLRKLEEVIKVGTGKAEVSGVSQSDLNDNASETSAETDLTSLFDENWEKDNGSDNSLFTSIDDAADQGEVTDNKPTTPSEGAEQLREKIIQEITALLRKEPVVSDSDLKIENQNWLVQLKTAKTSREIVGIQLRVKLNVGEIKRNKQSAANLNNLVQELQNGSKTIDINVIATFNQNSGNDDNKEKEQETREVMIQQDPELYFETFIKWVEEEEKKIEEERKKLKETNPNLEIEWTEREQKLFNGEITDPEKKKEIVKQIEDKINAKKNSWNLWKWLQEMKKWIKTKAKLLRKNNKIGFENKKEQIKKELENKKNSSNRHIREAYSSSENQVNNLLAELDAISQENQTVAPSEKGFFRPEIVIPISLVAVVAIAAAIVIRKRKSAKAKK